MWNWRVWNVESDDLIANELAFFPIHDASTEYGIPRWTGSIEDILGVRASEVLNFSYFESGTILPAAIIVDGGQLTEGSIEAQEMEKELGMPSNYYYLKQMHLKMKIMYLEKQIKIKYLLG